MKLNLIDCNLLREKIMSIPGMHQPDNDIEIYCRGKDLRMSFLTGDYNINSTNTGIFCTYMKGKGHQLHSDNYNVTIRIESVMEEFFENV